MASLADGGNLLGLVALLAAALAAAGWLSHRLRLPPAVGYLGVGLAASQFIGTVPEAKGLLTGASQVGVLFFLFLIGLEIDLRRLREVLRKTALTMPLDILVPALVLTAAVHLAGWPLLASIALGLALSVSSTLFGERLAPGAPPFAEVRKRVLGVLLSEDVAAGAILALLAVLGSEGAGASDVVLVATTVGRLLVFLVLVVAAALLVVPRLLDGVSRTHRHELFVLVGIACVVGFGALGGWAGSAPLGAFLAGVAAAEAGSRFVVRNAMQGLRDAALALFFFTAGATLEASQVALHPALVFGVAALFLVAKVFVHLPTALGSGLNLEASLRTAFALGTVGEFSLIIAAEARRENLADSMLSTAVVGAMLVLLVATPLLLLGVPGMVRLIDRIPEQYRRPIRTLIMGFRRTRPQKADLRRLRSVVALLFANLILLGGWLALAFTFGPALLQRLPNPAFAGPAAIVAIAAAGSIPLLWGTYRAYRNLVWLMIGLEAGKGDRGLQVRARLVDAWVAATVAILLIPLTLLVPTTLPALLAGLFAAAIISTLAWRRLLDFHRTLERTLGRVLGQDPQAEALLDRVLEQYPWGVRVAAVAVPPGSPLANHRLGSARLPELTGATVAVLQRRGREVVNPGPDELVHAGDTVVLLGDAHQIARAEAVVVAHEEALRMQVASRLASVVEVELHAGSSLVGASVGAADLKGRTGTLVVGIWAKDARHPVPPSDAHVLAEGDRLIILGAPLPVERARLLAEGTEHASTVEGRPEESV